jgi:serine/threonine-protein kinase HipA
MRLDVWIEGRETPLGILTRSEDFSLSFTYGADVAPEHRLSLSIPLPETPSSAPVSDAACRGYFSNLLFEGPLLQQVIDAHRLDRGDIGSILSHIGADCPGAVSVTPEGSGPAKRPGYFPQDYEALDDVRLHEIVLALHLHRRLPDALRDPSPVAGVQGKIAVVEIDGQLYLPRVGERAPTTHILKVSPQAEPNMTADEVALLALAEVCDIRTAQCRAMTFLIGEHQIGALLSTRFDRSLQQYGEGYAITRVHAEDLCQAIGLAPSLKYERDGLIASNTFTAKAVGRVAAQASVPLIFQKEFIAHTLFNLIVGNTDNHAKNASILHSNGGFVLAPLYDVVPVFMDPEVTHQLAFWHGDAHFAEDVTETNLMQLLMHFGAARPKPGPVLKQMSRMVAAIMSQAPALARKPLVDALAVQAQVVAATLRADFPIPERDQFTRVVRDISAANAFGWDEF